MQLAHVSINTMVYSNRIGLLLETTSNTYGAKAMHVK